jgi:uncharacterized protein DUF2846
MKLVTAFILVFATAAFARQQPVPAESQPADPARQEQKATNPPAAGAKATIYVYRLRLTAGMFNKPPIYVDEKEIARITNGRFFLVNLDSGRHVIRSEHKAAVVTLDVNPGQTYYIRVAWEATAHTARAATTLVPPEQGWAEIGQTESSNPPDIKDHELAAIGAMPPNPAPAPATAHDLSAPGTCRTITITRSLFPPTRFNVIDVVNYPGAYVGKWYLIDEMPGVERDGVKIFLLAKGYTPEDVAKAHGFCQSGAKEAESAAFSAPQPAPFTPQQPEASTAPPPPAVEGIPEGPAPTAVAPGASSTVAAAPQIARLRVYRQPQFAGSALFPSIYVDGRQVARVGNGRRVTIKLIPGSHYIKSDDNGSAITLDVKVSQDYYLRVDKVQGMMKGKGKVTLVSSEQGAPEYNLQRPIEENRVVAPEMVENGGGRLVQVPSAQLEADITRMIRALEAADHPGCELQIVKQSHSADRPVVERWDVKSCEAISSYDVQIVPSPRGGSDFRVLKNKSVLEQEKKPDTAAPPPVSSQAEAADGLPEGFVVYDSSALKPVHDRTAEGMGRLGQFTIALPKGWVAYDQSLLPLGSGNSRFNLIVFYLSSNPSSQDSTTVRFEILPVELMSKIDTGEIPSFFFQKLPAKKGMSCAGFSERAEKDVFKVVTGVPTFGKGATILEAPRSEPISVAGCKGIRVRGTGQPTRENTPQTIDVYAVSDGNVLYLFTLRNHADYYKKNAEVFQKSMATAKLTAAK